MQLSFVLNANESQTKAAAGRYLAIASTGNAASVAVQLRRGTQVVHEVRTAARGWVIGVPDGFDAVQLLATSAASVEVIASDERVTVDNVSGSTINVTALTPLPVSNDRGAPGTPVYVSGLTYSDAPATTVNDIGPTAATAAATPIVAANAARKALRITNIDTANAVAIGSTGITWAKRCIVLNPGATWVEERGANLAWSAICAAGTTATITAQEVMA